MTENKLVEQVVIYGCGGSGRELAWLAASCRRGRKKYQAVCFMDDDQARQGQKVNGIPVMSLEETRRVYPEARAVCSAGSPVIREKMVENAARFGFDFATLIHPRVERSGHVEIGPGAVICAGSVVTVNVIIGRHVQINVNCTVSHDAVLGDYCTLAPGAHITGCNRLGRGVFVGAGAVIINGNINEPIVIGDNAVIGAGAVVTASILAGVTVAGVPARPVT